MRIAKYIAEAGICSRRKAEELIEQGRVVVDGVKLTSPAFNVPEGAKVKVDGKVVAASVEEPRLWLFHKPAGCITSHSDPEKRKTVFDVLPKAMAKEKGRLLTVGRLDYNTEGLLLITNSGELANILMHPSRGWERTYRARVFGHVRSEQLQELKEGVTIKNEKGERVAYGPIKAHIERDGQGSNRWLVVTITEGKNREVRNICRHLGLEVNRLIRTAYGPFTIKGLERGDLFEAPRQQVRKLLRSVAVDKK